MRSVSVVEASNMDVAFAFAFAFAVAVATQKPDSTSETQAIRRFSRFDLIQFDSTCN